MPSDKVIFLSAASPLKVPEESIFRSLPVNVTLERSEQYSKTSDSSLASFAGRVILLIEVYANALSLIAVRLLPLAKITSVSADLLNASASIVVTAAGIVIVIILVPENAPLGILVRLAESVTEVK